MGLEEAGSTQRASASVAASRPPLRRIVTGADAFGSDLKDSLKEYLKERNIEVVDLGVDKYYSIAVKVASHLAKEKKTSATSSSPEEPLSRGLLVCGTGIGVSIFANKFGGVYAAPCNSVAEAVNARSINNTNVLTLGSMISSPEEGKKILEAWLETPFKAPCPASDGCAWNDEIDQFLDDSVQEMERISQAALENGAYSAAEGEDGGCDKSTSTKDIGEEGDIIVHDKSTCTADIGVEKSLKSMQSPVELLQEILASSTLFSATSVDDKESGLSSEERAGNGPGLTQVHATVSTTYKEERAGVGPGLMAIHAPISQPSIISVDSITSVESPTTELLAKNEELQGNIEDNEKRLDEGNNDKPTPIQVNGCAICALACKREFENVDIMPGGSWRILREDPTSAVVRFKAGSLEPAHHHTFGHDLIVNYGKKTVWNLSTEERFDLTTGDFLYTPAGDVHRVQYHEDTEFFIRWDGHWDILLDEDIDTAKAALNKAGSLAS